MCCVVSGVSNPQAVQTAWIPRHQQVHLASDLVVAKRLLQTLDSGQLTIQDLQG